MRREALEKSDTEKTMSTEGRAEAGRTWGCKITREKQERKLETERDAPRKGVSEER